MRRTGLSRLRVSDKVNLERALKISSRLGGHIVSGHIDGTGILVSRFEEDNALWLTIEAEISILKYMVMKGSVTLDGVSLTIAHFDERCFKVSLIPHTAGETTLGFIRVGEQVNIECDLIGKYVERFVSGDIQESKSSKDISIEFLRSNGFA
jgi:riboflavin synthase